MGDINFTIAKDVDLNKVVNLDINKDVNVDVNNDDILATAEADAEAFGPRALAETDAYTYVRGEGGEPRFIPVTTPGEIDALGNANPFEVGPLGDDEAPDTIGISFLDVDDVNAVGALAFLEGIPAGPTAGDVLLPNPLFSMTDLNLTQSGDAEAISGGFEAEYISDADLLIDFGPREVDGNGNGEIESNLGETGLLTLTVPAGTEFLADILDGGGIEVEFDALLAGDAFFTYTPDAGPDAGTPLEVPTEGRLVFDSETLAVFADWAFEAIGDFPGYIIETGPGGTGEAFSYAESTAALDLNGDDNVVPIPPETEL